MLCFTYRSAMQKHRAASGSPQSRLARVALLLAILAIAGSLVLPILPRPGLLVLTF